MKSVFSILTVILLSLSVIYWGMQSPTSKEEPFADLPPPVEQKQELATQKPALQERAVQKPTQQESVATSPEQASAGVSSPSSPQREETEPLFPQSMTSMQTEAQPLSSSQTTEESTFAVADPLPLQEQTIEHQQLYQEIKEFSAEITSTIKQMEAESAEELSFSVSAESLVQQGNALLEQMEKDGFVPEREFEFRTPNQQSVALQEVEAELEQVDQELLEVEERFDEVLNQ